jgi:hypothetical protein
MIYPVACISCHRGRVKSPRDSGHIQFTVGGVDIVLGQEPEERTMLLRTIIWVYGVLLLVGFYMGSQPL